MLIKTYKSIFVFAALVSLWGIGQPSESHAAKLVEQHICILEHMGNTRSPLARIRINEACNFLSLHEASLILNREQRAFHECVLKYLPGVEADFNATDLTRSCQQLAWDRVKFPK